MNAAKRTGAVLALLLAGTALADAQTLRDPTRPPGRSAIRAEAAPRQDGLVLQSILNSPERKAAVVNGKVVGPGETVDGFMLVGIAEDEVVLKNGADVRRLRLYPSVGIKKQRQAQGAGAEAAPGPGTQ
jgi:MSHA biogenesis protein MshK